MFGRDVANETKDMRRTPPTLEPSEIQTLGKRIINALDESKDLSRDQIEVMIQQNFEGHESRRYAELHERHKNLELE